MKALKNVRVLHQNEKCTKNKWEQKEWRQNLCRKRNPTRCRCDKALGTKHQHPLHHKEISKICSSDLPTRISGVPLANRCRSVWELTEHERLEFVLAKILCCAIWLGCRAELQLRHLEIYFPSSKKKTTKFPTKNFWKNPKNEKLYRNFSTLRKTLRDSSWRPSSFDSPISTAHGVAGN